MTAMKTLEDFISGLNNRIFLPGLQREFVWNEKQITMIFDSFIRSYPVGQITLWETDNEKNDFTAYKFINKFIDGNGRVPQRIQEREARRYNERVTIENIICDYLLIDGQQRLNSAYVGLCGSLFQYTGGRGGDRANERFWSEKLLCINILGSPDYPDAKGLELAGDYEFEFRAIDTLDTENKVGHAADDGVHRLWFPIRDLINEDGRERKPSAVEDDLYSQIEDLEVSAAGKQRQKLHTVATRVASKFRENVLGYNLPSTIVDYSSKEVHEIFSRINLAGERPKPYQYTQSLLATYCPYTEEGEFHPREKLKSHIETLSRRHPVFDTVITREFLTRCLVFLIDEDLRQSSVEAFSKNNEVKSIRDKWIAPDGMDNSHGRFENAVDSAFETVNSVGLTPKSIPSELLIAILAKFYYENQDADVDDGNKRAAFSFIAKTELLNALTASKGRTLARSLTTLRPDDGFETFPGDQLLDHLDLYITGEHIDTIVDNARYDTVPKESGTFTHQRIAALLALLDEGYADIDINRLSVDHIYPQARADDITTANASTNGVTIHRIGNLQLLDAAENRRKGSMLPQEWLDNLGEADAERYRSVNHYPEKLSLTPDAYEDFVRKRENEMKRILKEKYII